MIRPILIFAAIFLIVTQANAQEKIAGKYYIYNTRFYPKDTNILIRPFEGHEFAPFMIKDNPLSKIEQGKVGFIDRNGNIVIKPEYLNCTYFVNGHAIVSKKVNDTVRLGLINRNGNTIIPIKYDKIAPCSNGLYMIAQANKIGFINTSGKILVKPEKYSWFSMHWFLKDFQYSVFAISFNLPTWYELRYPSVVPFDRYIGVKSGEKWAVIDSTGKEVLPPQFDEIGAFKGDVASVLVGKKWGLLNVNGNIVVPPIYDKIRLEDSNGAYVSIGRKEGLISFNNKMLIPMQYIVIDKFGEGHITFSASQKEVLYDNVNKPLLRITAPSIRKFPIWGIKGKKVYIYNGKHRNFNFYQDVANKSGDNDFKQPFFYKRNNKWGLMDSTGAELTLPLFDKFNFEDVLQLDYRRKFISVQNNNKWGIIDGKGNVVLPTNYDNLFLNQGWLIVTSEKKFGLFNSRLQQVTPVKYDDMVIIHPEGSSSSVYIRARIDNKWGVIDTLGKEIVPFTDKPIDGIN